MYAFFHTKYHAFCKISYPQMTNNQCSQNLANKLFTRFKESFIIELEQHFPALSMANNLEIYLLNYDYLAIFLSYMMNWCKLNSKITNQSIENILNFFLLLKVAKLNFSEQQQVSAFHYEELVFLTRLTEDYNDYSCFVAILKFFLAAKKLLLSLQSRSALIKIIISNRHMLNLDLLNDNKTCEFIINFLHLSYRYADCADHTDKIMMLLSELIKLNIKYDFTELKQYLKRSNRKQKNHSLFFITAINSLIKNNWPDKNLISFNPQENLCHYFERWQCLKSLANNNVLSYANLVKVLSLDYNLKKITMLLTNLAKQQQLNNLSFNAVLQLHSIPFQQANLTMQQFLCDIIYAKENTTAWHYHKIAAKSATDTSEEPKRLAVIQALLRDYSCVSENEKITHLRFTGMFARIRLKKWCHHHVTEVNQVLRDFSQFHTAQEVINALLHKIKPTGFDQSSELMQRIVFACLYCNLSFHVIAQEQQTCCWPISSSTKMCLSLAQY